MWRFCFVCAVAPWVTHLRTLVENDIEIRIQHMDLLEKVQENSFSVVPVATTNKTGHVFVKIDPEDQIKVNEYKNWRMTTSGYAVSVQKRQGTIDIVYLHKLVMGGTCKHLNGDLQDCRKSNLSPSFEIAIIPFSQDTTQVFDYRAVELTSFTGYASVDYPNDRRYSGHLRNGKPDGYGLLVGKVESQQGIWENGELMDGIVTDYVSCACNDAVHHGIINCPLYEITRMDLVRNGCRIVK